MEIATADRAGTPGRTASEEDAGELPGGPLENPAIEGIPGDPLLEPHPSEPGVKGDGVAAPLENPGGRHHGR
jgi:hypothetical protein